MLDGVVGVVGGGSRSGILCYLKVGDRSKGSKRGFTLVLGVEWVVIFGP